MSDADSDAGGASSLEIEQTLRRVARAAIAQDDNLTVNLVRARVEEQLNLGTGFLKGSERWKQKSKDIINAEVDVANENVEEPAPRSAGTKRKSSEPLPTKPKKRRRKQSTPVEIEKPMKNGREAKTRPKPKKMKAAPKPEEESELSHAESGNDDEDPPPAHENSAQPKLANGDDDNDMSSVNDDTPPKKKRAKKSTSPNANTKPTSKPSQTSTKPEPKALSPDDEEIKRLQSWLLKCGVRKLWHRELAPYSSAKDKIRHLKGMLADVGMTGRFSAEKARGIKEARELAAELEAAREFNEQWGDGEGEEESGEEAAEKEAVAPRSRTRKPKGLVDFGDSDDDSE